MNALRRRDWEARVSRRAEARARVRSNRAWGRRAPDMRGIQVAVAAAAEQAKESGRMSRRTRTESRACPELSYCQRTCSGPDLRKYWAPKARHAVGNSCLPDPWRAPLASDLYVAYMLSTLAASFPHFFNQLSMEIRGRKCSATSQTTVRPSWLKSLLT